MTILRRADADLHDENGAHITAPEDRRTVGRLRRHLAAHEREAARGPDRETVLADLGVAGTRHASAYEALRGAQTELTNSRRELVDTLRAGQKLGLPVRALAERAGLNERTVRDYIELGHVRPRGK